MNIAELQKDPPDVLIVGSGGAGVCAAIEAAEAGARVAIVERASSFGGATFISGGGTFMVATPLQEREGEVDSVQMAAEDWLAWGDGLADEEWARTFIEQSRVALYDWLEDRGVKWTALIPQEGNRARRWHRPDGGGEALWRRLEAAARSAGVEAWIAEAPLVDLNVDEGRFRSAILEEPDGTTYEIGCGTLVVATGGFLSNRQMVAEFRPDLVEANVLQGAGVGALGQGHQILRRRGADLTNMDQIWTYAFATADPQDPRGHRGMAVRGIPDYVWINAKGARFHNEDLVGGASGAPSLLAQPAAVAWAVIDRLTAAGVTIADPAFRQAGQDDRAAVNKFLETSPNVRRADTLKGLAEAMGVPVGRCVKALEDYNGAVASGAEIDPATGRGLRQRRGLSEPPFYAIKFQPMVRKNLGGVRTDLKCRVLDVGGEPIVGIYAAGEVAGMAGGHINGRRALEGTMIGPALFSGRVAGAWAAQAAGFGNGFQPAGAALTGVSSPLTVTSPKT